MGQFENLCAQVGSHDHGIDTLGLVVGAAQVDLHKAEALIELLSNGVVGTHLEKHLASATLGGNCDEAVHQRATKPLAALHGRHRNGHHVGMVAIDDAYAGITNNSVTLDRHKVIAIWVWRKLGCHHLLWPRG